MSTEGRKIFQQNYWSSTTYLSTVHYASYWLWWSKEYYPEDLKHVRSKSSNHVYMQGWIGYHGGKVPITIWTRRRTLQGAMGQGKRTKIQESRIGVRHRLNRHRYKVKEVQIHRDRRRYYLFQIRYPIRGFTLKLHQKRQPSSR